MTVMPLLGLVANIPKGTIVPKQLNEMTTLELMDARLVAIDANDAERAQLAAFYTAATYNGYNNRSVCNGCSPEADCNGCKVTDDCTGENDYVESYS